MAGCCLRNRCSVAEACFSLLTAAFICLSTGSCCSFYLHHSMCLAAAPGSYGFPANVGANETLGACWETKLMDEQKGFRCNLATMLLRLFSTSLAISVICHRVRISCRLSGAEFSTLKAPIPLKWKHLSKFHILFFLATISPSRVRGGHWSPSQLHTGEDRVQPAWDASSLQGPKWAFRVIGTLPKGVDLKVFWPLPATRTPSRVQAPGLERLLSPVGSRLSYPDYIIIFKLRITNDF